MSPQAAKKAAAPRFDFSEAKVLVVDDIEPSLELISQVLLGFGVRRSSLCPSVAEARRTLAERTFDLIIADGEMPTEDGFDLIQELRRDETNPNFTVPVILASGYMPRDKVARARDAGANLVILKPIVPGVLLSRIQWLATGKRDFVQAPGYCGPDRRLRKGAAPEGLERRASEREPSMTQREIDVFFDKP